MATCHNLLLPKWTVPLPEIYPYPAPAGLFNELIHLTNLATTIFYRISFPPAQRDTPPRRGAR